MRNLVIGGIAIPVRASHKLTQKYEPVQSVSRLRMLGGSLTQQTAWAGKLVTNITAEGSITAGVQSLDFSQPVIIKCIAERTVTSASNIIVIPAERRVDYAPEGRALVGDVWVSTPAGLAGDTITLTVVQSAVAYQAIYWPEITCYCDPPSESRNARKSIYSWTLSGAEI